MQPIDLLSSAQDLLSSANGKPRKANLLRASSTIYYAMFHTLARCCADCVIGGSGSNRSAPAWVQVYRALEHNTAKRCCTNNNQISKFPTEIQDFSAMFVSMQEKRHRADYDPQVTIYKSEVIIDLEAVTEVIKNFSNVSLKDRRAFAAFVLLRFRQ